MANQGIQKLTATEKKKSVIADYDDIAGEYTRDFFYDTSYHKYIDVFLESLDGLKVLDVGCGDGRDCKYIFEQGFDVDGIDLSLGMLSIAKEKVPNGRFEVMDIADITYSDNSYDGLIANGSLFHIPSEELPKTLESFSRVLKPNGKLLLILQEGIGETMIEEPYRSGVYVYMNYFSVETISNLLQEYGFKIWRIEKERRLNVLGLGNTKLIVFSRNIKNEVGI